MKEQIETDEIIRLLEERLLQPDVRRSANAVSELLADGFVEFGSSGLIFTKERSIEGLQSEKVTQWTLLDFKTQTLEPGVILATYRAVKHEHDGRTSYSLRSSIWRLIENRWQMIFHQGTPAKDKILV